MRTALLLLAVPGLARAATLEVGPGKPYATIGAAVEAAANGDVIEVGAGTYPEFLDVTVDVEIVGLGGSAATTLGVPDEDVVEVFGADVTIRGFTFQTRDGRAVDIDGGSIVLDDVLVVGSGGSSRHGAAVRVQDATATISASTIEGSETTGLGGAIAVFSGALTLDGVTIAHNEAGAGGGLYASDAVVTITGGTFDDNAAVGGDGWGAPDADGGAIEAVDTALTLVGVAFSGNEAGNLGGALALHQGAGGTLDGCTFDANEAAYGGAIYLEDEGGLTIIGARFTGNAATAASGGAIRWRPGFGAGAVDISDTVFEGNTAADYGGALAYAASGYVAAGSATFIHSTFTDNTALYGGAMTLTDVPEVTAVGNLFCTNVGSDEGGAVRLRRSGAAANLWTNNVFDANQGGAGGAMLVWEGGAASIVNNTFVGNGGLPGTGGAVHADANDVALINNVVAWTGPGVGVALVGSAGTLDHNAWWENASADLAGAAKGANAVTSDPLLGYVDDDLCAVLEVVPPPGSPLVDAGDPSVGADPDGSPPDIGAFGGPSADVDGLIDADADGATADVDCDDADPLVHPGAAEACNDVDDDCDGEIDEGCDDDPVDTGTPGDTGTPSPGTDGVVGAPVAERLVAGCACDAGGRAPAGWVWLLALVALRRRR